MCDEVLFMTIENHVNVHLFFTQYTDHIGELLKKINNDRMMIFEIFYYVCSTLSANNYLGLSIKIDTSQFKDYN